MKKVDVLAIGAHPDDVELSCSGTLMKCIAQGLSVGICDLTQGELGTRGSGELRLKEAADAARVIGASFRHNLGMADGFFEVNEYNKLRIIEVIRAAQPRVVLLNALADRHPDHGRGAELQKLAAFLSGLRRIETTWNGEPQEPWRPALVLHYIQDNFMQPDVVIDITPFWDRKMEAIMCFSSQFYNPQSKEPMSSISSLEFMENVRGRSLQMGRFLFTTYGEGFVCERPLGVSGLTDLL